VTLRKSVKRRAGGPAAADRGRLRIRLMGTTEQLAAAAVILREHFDIVYTGTPTPARREPGQQRAYFVARMEVEDPPGAEPVDLCARLGEHVRWCRHQVDPAEDQPDPGDVVRFVLRDNIEDQEGGDEG